MRSMRAIWSAVLFAVLLPGAAAAQDPDADRKVAGGGVLVEGWQGKADPANKQGLTVKDSRFAAEGNGFRITTGPAGIYWNPSHAASGDFTVRATFREPKQTYNHPHPFGVFIGGSGLETDTPTMLYCVAYRDGTFLVRQFAEGKVNTLAKKAPHDRVMKASGPEAEVVQEVGWNVKGPRVECVINGAVVWSADKSEAPALTTNGQTGIRVSHNSDAIVTGFAVSK